MRETRPPWREAPSRDTRGTRRAALLSYSSAGQCRLGGRQRGAALLSYSVPPCLPPCRTPAQTPRRPGRLAAGPAGSRQGAGPRERPGVAVNRPFASLQDPASRRGVAVNRPPSSPRCLTNSPCWRLCTVQAHLLCVTPVSPFPRPRPRARIAGCVLRGARHGISESRGGPAQVVNGRLFAIGGNDGRSATPPPASPECINPPGPPAGPPARLRGHGWRSLQAPSRSCRDCPWATLKGWRSLQAPAAAMAASSRPAPLSSAPRRRGPRRDHQRRGLGDADASGCSNGGPTAHGPAARLSPSAREAPASAGSGSQLRQAHGPRPRRRDCALNPPP